MVSRLPTMCFDKVFLHITEACGARPFIRVLNCGHSTTLKDDMFPTTMFVISLSTVSCDEDCMTIIQLHLFFVRLKAWQTLVFNWHLTFTRTGLDEILHEQVAAEAAPVYCAAAIRHCRIRCAFPEGISVCIIADKVHYVGNVQLRLWEEAIGPYADFFSSAHFTRECCSFNPMMMTIVG